MLLGEFDYDTMVLADKVIAPMFFISFMILFYLLLLNMFIAIIGAHFEDLKPGKKKDKKKNSDGTEDDENDGFFYKIYKTIKAKCKQYKERKKAKESS
jgi:hypothetical protein